MRNNTFFTRVLLSAGWMLAILTFVGVALAEGRVHWKSTTLKERSNHSWRLEMTIYLRRPPDIAEIPAKFEFQPIAYYERALVDGNKIVKHRVPLQSQQSIITDEDIGFLDPGSGKIQKRTRFSFKITRDHGFEAGEYRVTIRDGRTGRVMGSRIKLTLNGKNPVVDRRTMVFSGNIGKKKKKKKSTDGEMQHVNRNGDITNDTGGGASGAGGANAQQNSDQGAAAGGEPGAAAPSSDESTDNDTDDNASGEQIKKKPGGCGCRLAGTESGDSMLWLAPLGLIAALAFRRRRRAA